MSAEVVVSGIAAGGDGVGRLPDGRAVFLPLTAPGDRVLVRAGSLRLHGSFARAAAGEIVRPARGRATPACPHYVDDQCGGCQLQHLEYAAQLAAKRAIVGDCLRRIGRLDVADPEIVGAGSPWRYRTKISLAVGHARARRPRGRAGLTIGLHPHGRPGTVFPLADCRITDARLMALWREARAHQDLFPARMKRLTLRLDREGRHHIIAESPDEPWRAAGRLRAVLSPAGVADVLCWWRPSGGAARVVAGPVTGFPATAFEQVHPGMGEVARRWAVERLGPMGGAVAWDLYGGVGDTARLLAERGATVVSVDADRRAIAWARRRRDLPAGAAPVRFVAGRAEDIVAELPAAQAVVVNPPRAGLHPDVVRRLTQSPVARLVYLSCDPATLARDLDRLRDAYALRAVRAFDLFPQTAHVETGVDLGGAA